MSETVAPKTLMVERPRDESEPIPRPAIVWMQPIVAILIRTGRTFGQSLLGLLPMALAAVSVAGDVKLGPTDLVGADLFLRALALSASWSVGPAVVAFLHNGIELLARLDESNPAIRA